MALSDVMRLAKTSDNRRVLAALSQVVARKRATATRLTLISSKHIDPIFHRGAKNHDSALSPSNVNTTAERGDTPM